MESESKKITIEKLIAVIVLSVIFIYIPYKILKNGFSPEDDSLRHIAFSVTEQKWEDVLVIESGLEADHNKGWHQSLRAIYKLLKINKEQLFCFSVIFLFFLINITGSLFSPNVIAWSIVLLIMCFFNRSIIFRFMLGRPYIISCSVAIVLFKLWFSNTNQSIKWNVKYPISIIVLTLAVWLHGTWYTFLLLPLSISLSGKIKEAIKLTVVIFISTILGAYLTGELKEFLYFHYFATLNIFTEKIYNWQLVTEFAEGDTEYLWLIPTLFIIILLVYSKKIKLNELNKDSIFILILLTWLLSIKVYRFWDDWGVIALMFWLSCKLSILIQDMETVKKTLFRWVYFATIVFSISIFIPNLKWNNKQVILKNFADFSKIELLPFKPEEGGIIYNDSMRHFFLNYYANPYAKYKYVLGFEPAIMRNDNKKVFREISYSGSHFSSYKPWIDKLTSKDRIFTSVDIRDNYPELDWVKVSKSLFIGKTKTK